MRLVRLVRPTPLGAIAGQAGGAPVTIQFGDINVNATSGTPQQNTDLVAKIGKAIEHSLDRKISRMMGNQMRPGGTLRR